MNTNKRDDAELCWFCEAAPARETSAAIVEMHKGGFVAKGTEYYVMDTTSLSVPRCERCKSVHDRVEGHVAKGGVVGLIFGLIIALWTMLFYLGVDSIKDNRRLLLVIICIFGMAGGIVAWATIGRLTIPKDVKDQRAREKHPLVQQKVREGWKVGHKPPGL